VVIGAAVVHADGLALASVWRLPHWYKYELLDCTQQINFLFIATGKIIGAKTITVWGSVRILYGADFVFYMGMRCDLALREFRSSIMKCQRKY
jgi:hypothetical protein